MDFVGFQAILHTLHIDIEGFHTLEKEIEWVLKDLPGEFEDMKEKEAIFRFELLRRLFLERNL